MENHPENQTPDAGFIEEKTGSFLAVLKDKFDMTQLPDFVKKIRGIIPMIKGMFPVIKEYEKTLKVLTPGQRIIYAEMVDEKEIYMFVFVIENTICEKGIKRFEIVDQLGCMTFSEGIEKVEQWIPGGGGGIDGINATGS